MGNARPGHRMDPCGGGPSGTRAPRTIRGPRGEARAAAGVPGHRRRCQRGSIGQSHAGPIHGIRALRARLRHVGVVGVRLSRARRELGRSGRHATFTGGRDAGMERLVSLPAPRTVFFVSDRTGITAEMLGNSLLSQFEGLNFQRRTIPFVYTPEKLDDVLRRIDETAAAEGRRPLVFSSIVDEVMSAQLGRADAMVLDLFQVFIAPLEAELAAKSSHAAGRSHGIANSHEYFARMEAINFTQTHDDGATTRDLVKAQIILIGVSRCGKTPTALYLALQFGILAAHFPLTPDDFVDRQLPRSIVPFRDKLFGLTIDPERLQQLREARRPASKYASLANCEFEVREATSLMQRERVPTVNTTNRSIEEIATTILHRAGLQRHIY